MGFYPGWYLKKVDVKVRVCQSKQCMAIDQPFPADIGKVIELF